MGVKWAIFQSLQQGKQDVYEVRNTNQHDSRKSARGSMVGNG